MLREYTPAEFRQRFLQAAGGVEYDPEVEESVRSILADVSAEGDEALVKYTARFDGVELDPTSLAVGEAEFRAAEKKVSPELKQSLQLAAENIRVFHERERQQSWEFVNDSGTYLGQRVQPIDRVGLYVPGGRAAYPSTLLMNAIPAQLAGVEDIIICTPPLNDGSVNQLVLAAASLLGLEQLYRVGGAQAVGAMALGTSSIPSVDKVVGPGNKYVTAAKRRVYGLVDIESLAGPSELAVMCDDTADARLVAADLLAQAEHDPDARVYLFTPSRELLQEVQEELSVQLPDLERSAICRQAIEQWGGAVQAEEELLWDLLNSLAPEHLSLQLEESMEALENVRHAGAVFIGANSAVSFGDYTAGPNHVLPTDRTARFSSPLGVHSFMKRTNVLGVSGAGMQELAEATQHLASAEGLTAHARAVQLRVSVDDGGETAS